MTSLTHKETLLLGRPLRQLIVVSDVFPTQAAEDPDAVLTTKARHLMMEGSHFFSDKNAPYMVELVVQLQDLVRQQIENAGKRANEILRRPHAQTEQAQKKQREEAVRVIANKAPRNGKDKNGEDFYLAITDNDVEIYATPLEYLKYVRHRIQSLFRIPTKGHPLFNGEHEQFRSSVIARSNEFPEHLVRIEEKEVETLIPVQKNPLELAYADHFGNLRLRAHDRNATETLIRSLAGDVKAVNVSLNGKSQKAHLVQSLREIPVGEFGIYENVADKKADQGPGYFELNIKQGSAYDSFNKPETGTPVTLDSK